MDINVSCVETWYICMYVCMYVEREVGVPTHYISRLNKRASVRLASVETTRERQCGIKRNRERGKKEIKEAAARACRHLDHGTHFASLISRKDSVRVTGVFRLQGLLGNREARGSSPRSLTVWYLNSKTRAKPTDSFSLFSHRPRLARGVS